MKRQTIIMGKTLLFLSGSGWRPEVVIHAEPEKYKDLGILLSYWDLRASDKSIQVRRMKFILSDGKEEEKNEDQSS